MITRVVQWLTRTCRNIKEPGGREKAGGKNYAKKGKIVCEKRKYEKIEKEVGKKVGKKEKTVFDKKEK